MSATALSSVMQEAQRQRELFAKAPRVSYENLTALAGARPGGLSLLLRPQVQEQSPVGGAGAGSGNGAPPPPRVRPAGGFGGLGLTMSSTRPPVAHGGHAELSPIPPTPAAGAQGRREQPGPMQQQQQQPPPQQQQQQQPRQQTAPPPRRPALPRALSSSALPPHFTGAGAGASGSLGKSSVAGPVVTSGTTQTLNGSANANGNVNVNANANGGPGSGSGRAGGYRPKGPPAEMEYDDDDESDADGRSAAGKGKSRAPDELHLSKSVAQEKLRVLAERSAIRAKNSGGSGGSDKTAEAERQRLYDEAGVVPWAAAAHQHGVPPDAVAAPPPNRSMSTAPVGFPYNLPAPAPPSTPRTTRQQMLRNEMSESLRHNLLWQRKLNRTDYIGPQPRRTKSTVHVPSAVGEGEPARQGGEKSLVRVTLRAPGAERRDGVLPPMDPPVLDNAPKKKLVRNLSWADMSDYHRTGW
ncbi:hypothetical protein B0H15DRAFT_843698 [Mycena belliarum]|uniref:DUF3295 domain-containing protein n=1 Tax=Mycena belliarum TaxID=1033014 RepID=A0AAD6XLP3_9AGAR|nr:hypothetical protein B0H15DRAFT_843698 [Mycena belliae]